MKNRIDIFTNFFFILYWFDIRPNALYLNEVYIKDLSNR